MTEETSVAQDMAMAGQEREESPVCQTDAVPDPRPAALERQRDRARKDRDTGRPKRGPNGVAAREAAASPEAGEALATVKAAMPKGGRRKGSKSRPAAERAANKAAEALARKGAAWWDKATEQPYIAVQLLKHATPSAGSNTPKGTGRRGEAEGGIRVVWADENAHGQVKLHGPVDPDDERTLNLEFDSPDNTIIVERVKGNPEIERARGESRPAQPGDTTIVISGDDQATAKPVASDALQAPLAGPALEQATIDALAKLSEEQTPEGQRVRDMMKAACKNVHRRVGDRVRQNNHTLRELKAERRRVEQERERVNRVRMYSDPSCWQGGSDDTFGGHF